MSQQKHKQNQEMIYWEKQIGIKNCLEVSVRIDTKITTEVNLNIDIDIIQVL